MTAESDKTLLRSCRVEANIVSLVLWSELLPQKTWALRQAGAYGFGVDDTEEEEFLRREIRKLGSRVNYIDAAYHFPDNLSAQMAGLSFICVDDLAKKIGRGKILGDFHSRVTLLGDDLKKFLDGPVAKTAFVVVEFEPSKSRIKIEDLIINKEAVLNSWDNFQTKIKKIAI